MAAAAATFILKRAATSNKSNTRAPSSQIVTEALLQLERLQKKQKVKTDVQKLHGQWRLIFTASPNAKRSFFKQYYFPVRAHQTFIVDEDKANEGIFDNGVFVLGTKFRVVGPFRWTPERNRMEFSVDRVVLGVGPWEWKKDGFDKNGYSLEGRSVKDLPFFTFFAVRDDIACARGRTGGVALYARVPKGEEL